MEEHRKYIRINKALIVRFKISKNHLGMSSRSEDISEDGVRLFTLQRLEPGMILDLNFHLQESAEPIAVKGRVVWQNDRKNIYFPSAIGIQFVEIQPADRNRIRDYVNKVSAELKPVSISGPCHE
ncbi:MAG: PilZ domain-containing protein [Candidatus Omnitrophota bacterium]|nr:PilZ domain-containing protein [Candidatus Omnitrophota bacterium]